MFIILGAAPVEVPILTGTVGPDVIYVRGLTATGRFTFHPGFMTTATCDSKMTNNDGYNVIRINRG
ncbi:citrate (Si)-synthase, partial [Pseudomonas syringae pv. tagetis]